MSGSSGLEVALQLQLKRIDLLAPHLLPEAAEIADWRQALPLRESSKSRPATEVSAHHTSAEDAAHDEYFHVRRVVGDRSEIFLDMVRRARSVLHDEVIENSFAGETATWQPIDVGLRMFQRMVFSEGDARDIDQPVVSLDGLRDESGRTQRISPRQRWIRGHQLFAVLTQALIFSLHELSRAIRDDEFARMDQYLALSESLLKGSGATFVFTGAFSIEDYMNLIRPTMMPPAAPLSLSGLMSVDHRYLVRVLREMRPTLLALRVHNLEGHNSLAEALAEVYELHKHVCERFVGSRPSIRTAETTDKSGPTIIEQFKKLRLKPFEIR